MVWTVPQTLLYRCVNSYSTVHTLVECRYLLEYALAQAVSGHGQQFVRTKVLAVLAVLIKRTWYAAPL